MALMHIEDSGTLITLEHIDRIDALIVHPFARIFMKLSTIWCLKSDVLIEPRLWNERLPRCKPRWSWNSWSVL